MEAGWLATEMALDEAMQQALAGGDFSGDE